MTLSRDARYALGLFHSDSTMKINHTSLMESMGLSRRKSRKIIAELEASGHLIRKTSVRYGTRLYLAMKVPELVPSHTAIYSVTASSYISNSLDSSKSIYSNRAPNKFFDEVKGEEATMGYDIFKPTSTSDEQTAERRKWEDIRQREYQAEKMARHEARKLHRDNRPVADWNCKDVAFEFADRLLNLWSIPPMRVTQTRFVQALGRLRKDLGTNGAIEVAMLDIFFSSIKKDNFKDANHLWKAFVKMAPSIVEQARSSVITPEQVETAKVDSETQASKKLSLFEEE